MSALPDDDRLLLHAYVDGELDAGAAVAFERKLAADPSLADEHRGMTAFRGMLRDKLPRYTAPSGLRATVMTIAAPAARSSLHTRAKQYSAAQFAMAAVLLLGLALGSSSTILLQSVFPGSRDTAALARAEVVSGHVRALATGAPFEVASSDRHTVKPWFAGKVTFAPRVVDLAPEGFPLAGGRLDVVQGGVAATLVFRHGKHFVSLTEALDPGGERHEPVAQSADGFSIIHWTEDGIAYWAVSDAAPEEVEALVAAFRAKAKGA